MRQLIDEILDLIEKGESETVEFKKSTASLREGIETSCAFANHRGGTFYSALMIMALFLANRLRMIR